MSKGYRKTVKKDKPFLTKKEIIELIVIVAVIALAILLFNLLYDDGFISASQIQENDIVSFASKDNKDRYMLLGTSNEIEGFDRQIVDNGSAVKSFEYINQDESSPLDKIGVTGSFVNASTLVDSTLQYFQGLEGGSFTDKVETEILGHDAYLFSYTYDYYQAPEGEEPAAEEAAEPVEEEVVAEEPVEEETATEEPAEEETPASNVFIQNMSCYINIDDEHCIGLHLYLSGEDDTFYVPDEEVEAYVQQYTGAISLIEE